jgi:hypothetical protein
LHAQYAPVPIFGLGSMAMAAYMPIRLFRLPPGAGIEDLLLRRPLPNSRT